MINTKTILVTGSTSGIGKSTVQELVKHAKILILPVRTLSKGEELKTSLLLINPDCVIDLYEMNLNSLESVKSFATLVLANYQVIDTLINNAGIFNDSKQLTEDGIEETFQVNVLSQFILNNMLLPLLKKAEEGRIINVSSVGHRFGKYDIDNIQLQNETKNNIGFGTQAYFNSNLFRNLLTFKLARNLTNTTIVVNCLHPGAIKTGLAMQNESKWTKPLKMFFDIFTKSSDEGAKTTIFLALDNQAGKITGKYWDKCKVTKPLPISNNEQYQDQFWDYCKKLTNV